MAAGCTSFASFGIQPDAGKNARHSNIFSFRGGGASTLDLLDIAGGTTGSWSGSIVYDGGVLLGTGSCGCYSPVDLEGRFGYINFYTASAVSQIFRFDVKNRVMSPETATGWIQSGTAAVGDRVAAFAIIDGSDVYSMLLLLTHLATNAFELLIQA